jgi:hypothetical protein
MLAAAMNAPDTSARRLFLVVACLLATACRPADQAVAITQSTFGVYRTEQAGQMILEPASTVPFSVGQQYGWIMRLKTSRHRVRWREELTLPSVPRTWGRERIGSRTIASDDRSIITEREVSSDSGYIFNAWKIEPGDPIGHYRIVVSIEDGPSRTFSFDVE